MTNPNQNSETAAFENSSNAFPSALELADLLIDRANNEVKPEGLGAHKLFFGVYQALREVGIQVEHHHRNMILEKDEDGVLARAQGLPALSIQGEVVGMNKERGWSDIMDGHPTGDKMRDPNNWENAHAKSVVSDVQKDDQNFSQLSAEDPYKQWVSKQVDFLRTLLPEDVAPKRSSPRP